MENDQPVPWYAESEQAVFESPGSSETGLSESEASDRLARDSFNRLPEAETCSWRLRFFCQSHNVLIYVLIVASIVTAMLGHWIDASVIMGVVLLQSGDKVPADLRLFRARGIQIQESVLTVTSNEYGYCYDILLA